MRMNASEQIRTLRDQSGMTRKQFSEHLGIPLRTIEDWEAGRRTPPEYMPRLIGYQLKYEALVERIQKQPSSKTQPSCIRF